jgi:hypothetical protein
MSSKLTTVLIYTVTNFQILFIILPFVLNAYETWLFTIGNVIDCVAEKVLMSVF